MRIFDETLDGGLTKGAITELTSAPGNAGSATIIASLLQRAGRDDGQALEGARERLVALVLHGDAGARPLVDDRLVPPGVLRVVEPAAHGRGDRGSDALGVGDEIRSVRLLPAAQ